MAGLRVVTGQVNHPNGTPWGSALVKFKLLDDTYTLSPDATYPVDTLIAETESNGSFTVTLASGLYALYQVTLPDERPFTILVEDGAATTLESLRAATEGALAPIASLESILAGMLASYTGLGIAVEEDDAAKVATLGVLDFRTALNVTESPTGEANVSVDVGTASTQVAAGDHLHGTVYYTKSEVDAFIAAIPTLVRINGNSGAAGADRTFQKLSADATTNSTTTFAAVMTTTGVGSGTWLAQYYVRYQSAATGTGVKFKLDHSAISWVTMRQSFVATDTSSASGNADQGMTVAGLVEGMSARAMGATLGPTTSADTANADVMIEITALFAASGSASLILSHASEVAAASTVKAGTTLVLTKIG